MAVNAINFRFQDGESSPKLGTAVLYVPTGMTLAQYQGFATLAATHLDAVSGAKVVGAELNVVLSLTGSTIKADPVSTSLNERGGLIGMATDGTHNDSFRIPAILPAIMAGDEFDVGDAAIVTLISYLKNGDGTVVTKTRDGFNFIGNGLYGKKSFRRK